MEARDKFFAFRSERDYQQKQHCNQIQTADQELSAMVGLQWRTVRQVNIRRNQNHKHANYYEKQRNSIDTLEHATYLDIKVA